MEGSGYCFGDKISVGASDKSFLTGVDDIVANDPSIVSVIRIQVSLSILLLTMKVPIVIYSVRGVDGPTSFATVSTAAAVPTAPDTSYLV